MTIAEQQRVEVEPGVVFGTGGGRELKCDIYHPPAAVKNGLGVLLVHGGGWVQGDRSELRGYGILLGRKGYTCVASEYRLVTESPWPACLHDVKTAIRWMRANAERLGIDPAKIVIEGNSAGAHLVLMAAGTPGVPEFEGEGGNAGVSTSVAAVIAFYPPTGLGSSNWRTAREPGHVADARDGREDGAETKEVAVWPFEPLHWRVRGDDSGIDLADLLIAQVPLVDYARREVGEEDVGLLDDAVAELLSSFGVQVQLNRELAGVVVVEVAGDVIAGLERAIGIEGERLYGAEGVDLGLGFDAHDFGAEGREGLGGNRAGAEP